MEDDTHTELDEGVAQVEPTFGRQQRSLEVAKAQQKAKAVELRAEGNTYAEIASLLEISPGQAATMVKQALTETIQEPADELRRLEALRIERMWKIAWPKSQVEHFRGPFGAMDTQGEWFDRCVKLMERRSKLLGLDAAQEISFPELRAALFAMLREQMDPEQYQRTIAAIAE